MDSDQYFLKVLVQHVHLDALAHFGANIAVAGKYLAPRMLLHDRLRFLAVHLPQDLAHFFHNTTALFVTGEVLLFDREYTFKPRDDHISHNIGLGFLGASSNQFPLKLDEGFADLGLQLLLVRDGQVPFLP